MASALDIVKKFYPDVTHMKDATKDLEIEVTKADCNKAAVKNHKACAMAVACKRTMKVDGAIVSVGRVYLVKGDEAVRYFVPPAVSREIVAFDRGGSFAPGEYTLKKPERLAPRTYATRNKGSQQTNRAPRHLTEDVRVSLASTP